MHTQKENWKDGDQTVKIEVTLGMGRKFGENNGKFHILIYMLWCFANIYNVY